MSPGGERPGKSAIAVYVALLLCLLPLRISRAAYPIEDITLALPVTEGSQTAGLYGLIQRFASQYAKVSVRLNHLPGRGGSYAWSFLKDKPGTGYTLAALQFPSVLLLAADRDRIFAPEDMAPLAVFAYASNALWVAEDSPFRTLEDLTAKAHAADYGLIVAGVGSYTDQHMAHLIFSRSAGIKTVYLPLSGSVESVREVREKRADACWGYALDRSGMPGLRPLAVAAPERLPHLPDTPSFRELRMDVVSGQYFGLAAPVSARPETRELTAGFFLEVFSNQELRAEAEAAGFELLPLSPRELPSFAGRQRLEVENFLTYYPMFPKGRRPLAQWPAQSENEGEPGKR